MATPRQRRIIPPSPRQALAGRPGASAAGLLPAPAALQAPDRRLRLSERVARPGAARSRPGLRFVGAPRPAASTADLVPLDSPACPNLPSAVVPARAAANLLPEGP
ncbi:hypothetical protein CKO45_03730 [Paracraurococcus ruber]|uniref:Uncharacterized protein n=1 Tax=Paracraurococcus ruber TaxID=77675 RepID=A0ABS1CSI8_9PROT|nr:hypothetical protein [Paracraurococcus ruber]